MCTLIIATGVWQAAPLVVAANRDEALARPAQEPQLTTHRGVRIVAPKDVRAGGTWIGVNAAGLFVALTNRFGANSSSEARSRGMLVLDMLAQPSLDAAVDTAAELAPGDYNAFHLVLADTHRAHLTISDRERCYHHRLVPGVHVVSERSLGAASSDRPRLAHEGVQSLFAPDLPQPAAWAGLLRTKAVSPMEGICINDPALDYGTRSSSIFYLSERPENLRLLHSDGPPDVAVYRDNTPLLRRLLTMR